MIPHIKKNTDNLVTVIGERVATGEAFDVLKCVERFKYLARGREGDHIDLNEEAEYKRGPPSVFKHGRIKIFARSQHTAMSFKTFDRLPMH